MWVFCKKISSASRKCVPVIIVIYDDAHACMYEATIGHEMHRAIDIHPPSESTPVTDTSLAALNFGHVASKRDCGHDIISAVVRSNLYNGSS